MSSSPSHRKVRGIYTTTLDSNSRSAPHEQGIPELRKEVNVRSLTEVERMAYLKSLFIEYPRLRALKEQVRKIHKEGLYDRAFSSSEPICMFIGGESNAGKSALMNYYEQDFRRIYKEERTIVPILPVVLPSPASPKSVAIRMLQKIGDRNAERGSTVALTSRAAQYIKDCQVELIVLDELHHFISRDSQRVLESVAEWLKDFLLETKVPIVALGKPIATQVLDYDEQLARRFPERYQITPFSWDYNDPTTIQETRSFLTAVDYRLPLAEPSRLGSHDIASRIHYATDGVVGYMMTLVREAATKAIEQSQECISLDHLSQAFLQRIKSVKPQKENPFTLQAFSPEQANHWRRQEVARQEKEIQRDLLPSRQPYKKIRASEVLRT